MIKCGQITPEELLATSKCLIKQNEVEKLMRAMTEEIELKLGGLNLIVLTIMNGGLVPTGIFMKYFQAVCQLDYIHLTRYGNQTVGGKISWHRRPPNILQNRKWEMVTTIVRQKVIKKLVVLEGFTINGYCHVNKRIFYKG